MTFDAAQYRADLRRRLVARSVPVPGGCREWQGAVSSSGYGVLRFGPRSAGAIWYAHRGAWFVLHGPIPPGFQIHHVCGNKRCVAVHHLQMVDQVTHATVSGRRSHSPRKERLPW